MLWRGKGQDRSWESHMLDSHSSHFVELAFGVTSQTTSSNLSEPLCLAYCFILANKLVSLVSSKPVFGEQHLPLAIPTSAQIQEFLLTNLGWRVWEIMSFLSPCAMTRTCTVDQLRSVKNLCCYWEKKKREDTSGIENPRNVCNQCKISVDSRENSINSG